VHSGFSNYFCARQVSSHTRETAVNQIKPLLTPDQITILEDAQNQWRENHAAEANDLSAN
jgi:hypothetical protein